MKRSFLMLMVLSGSLLLVAPLTRAQGSAKRGSEVIRDADLEKDSLHNLAAARLYFTLRKAYVASLQRCEEVLAGNPTFSKIDEILFIAGKSSLNLAESKGKQEPKLYVIHDGDKKLTLTADEFRAKARDYLSQLVNEHPQSSFLDQATEELKALGGPKPKDSPFP
jgi:outer membrane protein assembly factor BamD (BamD/ComL family)